MAEKLITSFKIGEDDCKVDYNSLVNKPAIPEDKSEELTTLKSKLNKIEDVFAGDLYNAPKIGVTKDDLVLEYHVVRGNETVDISNELQAVKGDDINKKYFFAYDKDGNGYVGSLQFNAICTCAAETAVRGQATGDGWSNIDSEYLEDGKWRVKATKVTKDFDIHLAVCNKLNVTINNSTSYEVTYPSIIAENTRVEFSVNSPDDHVTSINAGEIDLLSIEGAVIAKSKGNGTRYNYTIMPAYVTDNISITLQ